MVKILKCPGCDQVIRTGKTRDLNKYMNLNGNLRKGQCLSALHLMQNPVPAPVGNPLFQNPAENPALAPDDDLLSFNENPLTHQPREGPLNGIEFYNGKRKWYGVKEDFHTLYNKYHFIKADNTETVIETYKRIIEESEAIAEKTNRQINILKLFRETTLAPKRNEKIDEKKNAWLNLTSSGALVFAEKYEGEANQYDVNSMYIYEMLKKEASWPIAPGKFHTIDVSLVEKWRKFPYGIYKATIEGNPPKKSLQCTRYLRYNPHGIYTHYDLESDNTETVIETYKRIIEESEAIAEKTNRQINILKLFRETTLAPKRNEKIDEKKNAWLNLTSSGALVFAEKYEGEANQYDVNSMYIYEMLKKEASWPIAPGKFHTIDVSLVEKWRKFPYGIYKATIEGNPPKKSLQCTRYLRYNPHGIYTHYDLECAKGNGLNIYLIDKSPNALIYEKNTRINGKDMFGKWGNILYNIKKKGGTVEKVSKALLVSLWGALCEQRNGQNYGVHPRIKPFLLVFARKRLSEIVKPLRNQVKRIHTDGFIVAGQVNLKTGIEMGELKFEKRGPYPEISNLITNSLPDFEKIRQDKEQNTKLTVKRKAPKRYDINLPN
ncbi:hypothetical protein Glove_115g114 [Diversispora epigaea]|uniref:DNA-directed DNA polymerase n=1 Tax=Diversispora epigaea TaxID=1348612 RepID=A0A397J3K3_9GLOM|nr:hypothetical protein Glove_115g114 [Diversispora epigaea]